MPRKDQIISPANAGKWLNRFYDRINYKERITPHGFRHTYCSLLFEAGASVKEVQDRLRHADVKTTLNIYTHVSPKNRASTLSKFESFMSNKKTENVPWDRQF